MKKHPGILQVYFIISVITLLSVILVSYQVQFRVKVPIRHSFVQFPMNMAEWRGTRQIMEQQFIDALKFSDYISADYYDQHGKTINFYVVYYDDQLKGESVHSPESCLPSSGWDFERQGTIDFPAEAGKGSIKVNRAMLEKDGFRAVAYYWFPMRGKILTQLYEIKLHNFWDAMTKHRTDGALVMVLTPVYPVESMQDADQRLQKFVKEVQPALKDFLPE